MWFLQHTSYQEYCISFLGEVNEDQHSLSEKEIQVRPHSLFLKVSVTGHCVMGTLTVAVKSSMVEAFLSMWPKIPPEPTPASLSTVFSHLIFFSAPDPPCLAHLPMGPSPSWRPFPPSPDKLLSSWLLQMIPFQETLELLKITGFPLRAQGISQGVLSHLCICRITCAFLQLNETPFRKKSFFIYLCSPSTWHTAWHRVASLLAEWVWGLGLRGLVCTDGV